MTEPDDLRYTAAILLANKHKFAVPDHIAPKAQRLTEAADEIAALRDRVAALEGALEKIAASRFGLQNIADDHEDTNAYNYHAMRYFAGVSRELQGIARSILSRAQQGDT